MLEFAGSGTVGQRKGEEEKGMKKWGMRERVGEDRENDGGTEGKKEKRFLLRFYLYIIYKHNPSIIRQQPFNETYVLIFVGN